MKLYTFGWVIEGPGSRTSEPVPKEMTGKAVGAVERRRWASIERLLFDAQTVQNFSFHESVGVSAVVAVVAAVAAAAAAPVVSIAEVVVDVVVDVDVVGWLEEVVSGGGGGGGGGV